MDEEEILKLRALQRLYARKAELEKEEEEHDLWGDG